MKPLHDLKKLIDLLYYAKGSDFENSLVHFKNGKALVKAKGFKIQKDFEFEFECALSLVQLKDALKFFKERCSIVESEDANSFEKILTFNFENGVSIKLDKYPVCEDLEFVGNNVNKVYKFGENCLNIFKGFKNFKLPTFFILKDSFVLTDRTLLVKCKNGLDFPFEIESDSAFCSFAARISENLNRIELFNNLCRIVFESCVIEFEVSMSKITSSQVDKLFEDESELSFSDYSEKMNLIQHCLKQHEVSFKADSVGNDRIVIHMESNEKEHLVSSKHLKQICKSFCLFTFKNDKMFFVNDGYKGVCICKTN